MNDQEREDAARKIYQMLSPYLRKAPAKNKWEIRLFLTDRGPKTDSGLIATIADIIKNPYAD